MAVSQLVEYVVVITDQIAQDGKPREVEAWGERVPGRGDNIDCEDGVTRTVTDVRYRLRRRDASSPPSHYMRLVVTISPPRPGS
jgi:hypothetical protein